VQDGNETDTDCGGAQCDAQNKLCNTNKGCKAPADCQSGFCGGNACQLKPDGTSCSDNAQCNSNVCGINGSGNCCASACTGGACGATGCDGSGACIYPGPATMCGSALCTGGQLTMAGVCNGLGMCAGGATAACPGGVKCAADGMSCNGPCSIDTDCQSASDYCNGGSCQPKGNPGATCNANNQCKNPGKCGTTGTGHCCTASCPATVAACGATDCDASGACVYPDNTVAPAAIQVLGNCQKEVCDGSGATTTVNDGADLPGPSGNACLINPACCGPSQLVACYSNAPAGTSCSSGSDPNAHVCGDPANNAIKGKCVECNTGNDCLAINDAGSGVCDMTTGTCP
jgi:hypothetical protein